MPLGSWLTPRAGRPRDHTFIHLQMNRVARAHTDWRQGLRCWAGGWATPASRRHPLRCRRLAPQVAAAPVLGVSHPDQAEARPLRRRAQLAHVNKGYRGERYSGLHQITVANAARLAPVCTYQLAAVGPFQASPVVYDGLLYITSDTSTHAIDAATCGRVWEHNWVATGPDTTSVNRGVAVAAGRVVRGTQDGHVFALDAKTGQLLWSRQAGDPNLAEFFAAPPIVWNDLVIIGRAGGDWGTVGKVMAFRLDSGAPV
jgi:alcohol dehydrogenase (cytochrome c)